MRLIRASQGESMPPCDECSATTESMIEIGVEVDYAVGQICICMNCAKKLAELVRTATDEPSQRH